MTIETAASVRFPSPHLPLDQRFAKRYLERGRPGAFRVVVQEDRSVTCWESEDWEHWVLVPGDGVEVIWGEDGSLTLLYDGQRGGDDGDDV